jgi:putative CocE/NonD family hydrolase
MTDTAFAEGPTKIREVENFFITLKDGTRLSARMWLPVDAEAKPVPAILEYIPYRKRDATSVRDSRLHPYFAQHGYASVRVDMRGAGDSDGVLTDEYLPLEQTDGVEVIAWLAQQRWCTGKVGMLGNSWGGFNSLQVAARRPPELKAIITSCSTDDRYADDIHYMGGCLLNDNMKWGANMFSHNSRAPDPEISGERWRDNWLKRLAGSGLWAETWISHQRRDAFWKQGSVCEDYAAIECPVFAVGGWADGYTNAIPRLLAGLKVPRIGWIGQWAHAYPHIAPPGPQVGFLQEAVRWWDHWLKGRDTGIMKGPMLRAYMQDYLPPVTLPRTIAGRWVAEETWPSPHIRPKRLWLNAAGSLADKAGAETPLAICSPLSPGHYGRWTPHGLGPDMPPDQRELDGGALVFETAPLTERLECLGAPVVELSLSSDKPNAMVCVRLGDVAPDGKVTRVTYGLLNLTHRDGHENPAELEPGRRYRVRVQLNDFGQGFEPGHRIRVSVATSYWPIAWPSPENATLTIHTGASHLELPVRPARDSDAKVDKLPPPLEPPTKKVEVLIKGGESRKVHRDVETGETTLHVVEDAGTTRFDATGWTLAGRQEQRYSILPFDPLSARAEVSWFVRLSRGPWNTETRTRTVMTSTRTEFVLRASLEAYENAKRVFERTWDVRIPRDHV